MNLRRTVLGPAFLLIVFAAPAFAQLGVYGKLDLDRYTAVSPPPTGTFWLYGASVGVYDDFVHAGPIAVGADIRGELGAGNNYTYRQLLLGPRVALKLPVVHIRPYAELLAGVGGAKYTGPVAAGLVANYDNELLYGGAGGLDLTILPHVDWRVVEAEYLSQRGANNILLLSTGIVIRL